MPHPPPAETPIPYRLIAEVLWRRRDEPSFEICRVSELPEFIAIHGTVLTTSGGAPYQVNYVVQCDLQWVTRAVHVFTMRGRENRRLELARGADGSWRSGAEGLDRFAGIADVDLSITPSTNTLPIRRLALAPGASAETTALWVRFPDLALEALPQQYTRLSENAYAYESRRGEFRAQLETDAEGVVVRYGDIWTRLAPAAAGT